MGGSAKDSFPPRSHREQEKRAQELERRVSVDQATLQDLCELAELYLSLGDTGRAMEYLKQVVARRPNETRARLLLGMAMLGIDLAG